MYLGVIAPLVTKPLRWTSAAICHPGRRIYICGRHMHLWATVEPYRRSLPYVGQLEEWLFRIGSIHPDRWFVETPAQRR